MVTVFEGLSKEEVETFGLVLLSSGIVHQSVKKESGWELRVEPARAAEAVILIRKYQVENLKVYPAPETHLDDYKKSLAGVWGALLLVVVHIAVYTGADVYLLKSTYAASAGRILDGEWYRTATALLLHAGVVHLAGNMVGIAVLGSAVCSIMGWGVGWLMILSSGIAGNLMNAFIYKAGHSSIGASTAVFGALGILTAWQFLRRIKQPGRHFKALLPIGAGFALLGFMGSSLHADIMAHLFGFFSGMIIGSFYSTTVKQRPEFRIQAGAFLLVITILVRAWFSGCY